MNRSLALLSLGTLAIALAGDARADKLCVPNANGVPGKPGAPQWTQFDNPAVGDVNEAIDDPRWLGSSGHTIRSGSATPPLDFRTVYTTVGAAQYVEMSWEVNVAAIGSSHALYVGFMMPGDTSSAYMIRFHMPSADGNGQFWQCYGTDDDCANQCANGDDPITDPACARKTAWYEVYKYSTNCDHDPSTTAVPNCDCTFGYTGFTSAAVLEAVDVAPEWLAKKNSSVASATTWLPSATYTVVGGKWTLRVRVPLDASAGSLVDLTKGIRAGAQLWYEAPLDVTGTGASPHQQWPRLDAHGACFPDADPSRVEIPSPLTFGDVALLPTTYYPGFSPITDLPADCTGVSISSQDIKVIGPTGTPGNTIYGQVSGADFANVFSATVHAGASQVDSGSVTARFRVADWGSQPAPWGDQPDYPSGVWDDVPVTSGTNPAVLASTIAPGGTADLTATWTLSPAQRTQYGLGSGGASGQVYNRHECVMVELAGASTGASGGNVDFSQRSAYTNMEFGSMSTFEQFAKIAASPQFANKDVYLVMMPKNMAPGATDGWTQLVDNLTTEIHERSLAYGGFTYGGQAYGDYEISQDMRDLSGQSQFLPAWLELRFLESIRVRALQDDKLRRSEALVEALRQGASIPTLSDILPSVDVYVYVDTGETYSSGHTTHHVLTPMTSFGYDLWHDGAVQDYQQLIDNAVKIGPNVYRVRTDKNGNAIVKVVSQAVQPGETPVSQVPTVCGGGCCNPKCPTNVGLAETAPPLFAGVFVFRRRKKRS